MSASDGKNDPKKSLPPDPQAAAQVGQDLLALIHKDFVVEKKPVVPANEQVKGAQLGQDLLAQFAHDFGSKKKAQDEADLQAFGQQLLGAVARDFGSVRPSAAPSVPAVVIPASPSVPVFAAPPPSTGSSPGSIPTDLAPPPGFKPQPPRPVSLGAPPSEEVVKAEAELAKIEAAPLAQDEEAEVAAMQGSGAFGFFRRLFKKR